MTSGVLPINTMRRARKRILFFSEAVTLAHVARPISLARSLDCDQFDSTIAVHPRYRHLLLDASWTHVPLGTIESAKFLRALAKGSPVYDLNTLRGYVREDLQLIARHKPDVVVGDFRLSLSVSARLAKVPYISITNAYWSPYYSRLDFPLPVLPLTRLLPISIATAVFRATWPFASALHCRPMNRLRQEHGLPSLGGNLRKIYTDADITLYADVPEMFQLKGAPPAHEFIGPVDWSTPFPAPAWWNSLELDRPVIYVTLGSSGDPGLLERVLTGLKDLPVWVIASSAGARLPAHPPANARVAEFLPGMEATLRSSLVICNGGSPTCQQALLRGVPVIGIAGNMDQFMNMEAIAHLGAGILIRADRIDPGQLRLACARMLYELSYVERAQALSAVLRQKRIGLADLIERAVTPLAVTTA